MHYDKTTVRNIANGDRRRKHQDACTATKVVQRTAMALLPSDDPSRVKPKRRTYICSFHYMLEIETKQKQESFRKFYT